MTKEAAHILERDTRAPGICRCMTEARKVSKLRSLVIRVRAIINNMMMYALEWGTARVGEYIYFCQSGDFVVCDFSEIPLPSHSRPKKCAWYTETMQVIYYGKQSTRGIS